MGKNWSIRKSIERISKEEAGLFVLINHRDAKVIGLTSLKIKKLNLKKIEELLVLALKYAEH